MGIEFSYHFAKYFGISLGMNYGTVVSYRNAIYLNELLIEYEYIPEYVNQYETSLITMSVNEMLFPIKLEFHYPLRKDLFFTAEAGIKIKGINDWLICRDFGICSHGYRTSKGLPVTPDDYDTVTNSYHVKPYYDDVGYQDLKIRCNLRLGLGLSYKLPYGDLVRCTAGINLSFNNIIEGDYLYYLTNSYGTFAVKNDFIYTQLSYIHTFN
ncbi:MAG: hypothetical protein FWF70_01760 [Bacteroidetes bacterium]|nr:hypothetical protein [Bacteroidota bacterium]MCL1968150.1 hypothetical protein [Bacteroidota bacterium]